MMEQTKRQQLEMHLMRRAHADPEFRDELLRNPKNVIEKEIGLKFLGGITLAAFDSLMKL